MKRFFKLLVLIAAFCSCGRDDQLSGSQEQAFERYLSSTTNYVGELPCDTLDGVWRLLENPREERDDEPVAASGSEVDIYFEGYIFNSSLNLDPNLEQRTAVPFYTNRAALINALKNDLGMNVDANLWPTDPLVARLGSGKFFKGLDRGLRGAHKNDSLLLLITSENGYDNSDRGSVIKDSPLVFRIYVNDVR